VGSVPRVVNVLVLVLVLVPVLGAGCWVLGARCSVLTHHEFGRRHAGTQNSLCADLVPGDSQAAKRPLQLIEWQARIDERPKHHVAGNPGKTIEVQQRAHT
jgi:hypothetical protein